MAKKEVVTKTITTTTKHSAPNKKRNKKKTIKKKPTVKTQKVVIQQIPDTKVDRVLIENFVSLQRVLTNLSVKLDNVANQMSKLLDLFEISAKALAEKDFDVEKNNKEILERLDTVLDQNKTLARGITLMHERIPREQPPMRAPMPPPQPQRPPKPSPVQRETPMPMIPTPSAPEKREVGPAKTFSKEIDEEPEYGPIEPPRFESPL